ncbi:YiaA/YiaB family inner membrane protein [Nonomuraea sp. NPDC050328]|uniref:YiaA/YiaB family inner membrane protein n=1 Tax=Nonomuraea sp. NPDC050328 TaxID=3364361 RepID=UPI00379A45D4
MTTKPIQPTHTGAFYLQAVISFALAFGAVVLGIAYVPADAWVRGFLAVGVLYLVTSSFMLAKVVRDKQELAAVTTRVDQARLDKLLAEHDPFKVEA